MTRGLGGNSPANIQNYLKGVEYPADKDTLISQARSNDAPAEVMDTIQCLPRDNFGGPQDVMKAYGQIQ